MDQDLPEALRMAAELDACPGISYRSHAAKLRHQHTEIERLTAGRDAMGRMMDALQDERDTLRVELDRWHSELSAVMRPDFKDWESVAERPALTAWVITNLREHYAWAEGVIEQLTKERDALSAELAALAALREQEPVAVIGDCFSLLFASPDQISAIADRHGLKVGSKLYAAPVAQPVKRLTDEQISEIEDWFSNEFGLEAKHSTDFARAIETACAAAWGIKLED